MSREERQPLYQGGYQTSSVHVQDTVPPHLPPPYIPPPHAATPHPVQSVPQALGQSPSPQPHMLYVLAPHGSFEVPGSPGLFVVPQGQTMCYPPLAPTSGGNTAIAQFENIPKEESTRPKTLALVSLILYLLGIFLIPCQIASIALTLHMCRKGYIRAKSTVTIIMCVMELIAWAFVPAFAWYMQVDCYESYYNYIICTYTWFGWIAFVVYGVFELVFGIPRILFTWYYDSEEDYILTPVSSIPEKEGSSPRALARISLILYVLGIFIIPCQIPSIALSLHMCIKGYIRAKRTVVIAMSVMELIALAFIPAFAWYGEFDCYSYYCTYIWLGWISFVVYFAFEIAFGIPRILFTWRYDSEKELTYESIPTSNPNYYTTGYQNPINL